MTKVDVTKIAGKILQLQAEIAEREEAVKNMRATLSEHVSEGESFEGDFKFTKYTNTRFDDALAKKNLTVEEYDSIAVLKADSKRASALLDEDRLALCKKSFAPVVKIGLRD